MRSTLVLIAFIALATCVVEDIDFPRDLLMLKSYKTDLVPNQPLEKRQTCPNSCSSHGYCINGVCQCITGWTGSDCSISVAALPAGQNVTSTVGTFQFQYYNISLARGTNGFTIEVWQAGSGDCDLYVQYNRLPTRNDYTRRDISTDVYTRMALQDVNYGNWYVGVYGFVSCSYTIRATYAATQCLNDCSGHGTCSNGICVCAAGWYGADCSTNYVPITASNPISGRVNDSQMFIYRFDFTSPSLGNFQSWKLTQTSSGDCDLYVRYNSAPTLTQWDYANVSVAAESTLNIQTTNRGFWYAGVYGYAACAYSLRVDTSTRCPNLCSQRGTCSSSATCNCPSGFTGIGCENMTNPLTNAVSVNGYVDENYWNYYSFRSASMDNLVVSVSQQIAGADCDLFIKKNAVPTRFSFDYSNLGTEQTFQVTIPEPGVATWYFGIFGWSQCAYTIMAALGSACPNNCNGHGQCVTDTGVCNCDAGWTGVACAQTLTTMSSGIQINGLNVTQNQWQFYQITVSGTNTLQVQLSETTGAGGYLWLYVSSTGYPTLTIYDAKAVETNSKYHRINLKLPNENSRTYYIGVYGNPAMVANTRTNYKLVAWYPQWA